MNITNVTPILEKVVHLSKGSGGHKVSAFKVLIHLGKNSKHFPRQLGGYQACNSCY